MSDTLGMSAARRVAAALKHISPVSALISWPKSKLRHRSPCGRIVNTGPFMLWSGALARVVGCRSFFECNDMLRIDVEANRIVLVIF